ncbi:MAG: MFS transporter [Acidobacteria bacterium]|nr:MFS transporter [Acidobacteriota bacterium]
MNLTADPEPKPARYGLVVLAIGLAPFLGNLDGSIVMIATPTLARTFHADTADVSLVVVAYLLVMAGFSLIFGKLGDRVGTDRVFMAGYAVLTLGSVLCGLAPGLGALVAFRVVQAVGGTMLCATYCALIASNLPENVRGRAFGFTSVLSSVGFAIGAPVGGYILEASSWHWLFLLNVPFGLAGLFLSWKHLRRERPACPEKTPWDTRGAVLSLLALLSLVSALQLGQQSGWVAPLPLALFGVTLACAAAFVVRERTFPHPLVAPAIFRDAATGMAILSALLVLLILDGLLFVFPYYLEVVKGLASDRSGLVLMALPAAIFVFSPLAGYLSDKRSPRLITSLSGAGLFVGTSLFLFCDARTPLAYVVAAFAVFGVSFAFFLTANVTFIMGRAEPGVRGVLSGVLAVINNVGALLGVAVFQVVFALGAAGPAAPSVLAVRGFQRAALLAVALSVPILLNALFGRTKRP